MGLAWFFASYIIKGRFKHPLICMDDPAQEMDQITYRELCRLWETLLRLHKFHDRSLTLIIMLNQEGRALDAARATNGTLNILGWGGLYQEKEEHRLEKIKLLGDKAYYRKPDINLIKVA